MKLIYKGRYKSEEQLPKGTLPLGAVKFREPSTPEELNKVMMWFMIPALILIALIVIGSAVLHGSLNFRFGSLRFWAGIMLTLLILLPHELLHAICFGKGAEVELYVSPKQMILFVVSTKAITKGRFIFLSLLPNLVFGWAPLLIWAALPYGAHSTVLFSFSAVSILCGVGDYMNVYNAIRQMPKGSMQQLSGFNSYWFMP